MPTYSAVGVFDNVITNFYLFILAPPTNEGVRLKLNIPPALEICAPNFVSNEELSKIQRKFEQYESKVNQSK